MKQFQERQKEIEVRFQVLNLLSDDLDRGLTEAEIGQHLYSNGLTPEIQEILNTALKHLVKERMIRRYNSQYFFGFDAMGGVRKQFGKQNPNQNCQGCTHTSKKPENQGIEKATAAGTTPQESDSKTQDDVKNAENKGPKNDTDSNTDDSVPENIAKMVDPKTQVETLTQDGPTETETAKNKTESETLTGTSNKNIGQQAGDEGVSGITTKEQKVTSDTDLTKNTTLPDDSTTEVEEKDSTPEDLSQEEEEDKTNSKWEMSSEMSSNIQEQGTSPDVKEQGVNASTSTPGGTVDTGKESSEEEETQTVSDENGSQRSSTDSADVMDFFLETSNY